MPFALRNSNECRSLPQIQQNAYLNLQILQEKFNLQHCARDCFKTLWLPNWANAIRPPEDKEIVGLE
jgi:hypothetical protein